ncbi:MAG: PEP-CTERM sorting domain-containing protein [Myxococcales bacterium]|nr:PEP-CTERM sorting domain-containing protein [Myxococcales bacterium]
MPETTTRSRLSSKRSVQRRLTRLLLLLLPLAALSGLLAPGFVRVQLAQRGQTAVECSSPGSDRDESLATRPRPALQNREPLGFDPGLLGLDHGLYFDEFVGGGGGIVGTSPVVPEPGTASLLGLGLVGLAWRRRAAAAWWRRPDQRQPMGS